MKNEPIVCKLFVKCPRSFDTAFPAAYSAFEDPTFRGTLSSRLGLGC